MADRKYVLRYQGGVVHVDWGLLATSIGVGAAFAIVLLHLFPDPWSYAVGVPTAIGAISLSVVRSRRRLK